MPFERSATETVVGVVGAGAMGAGIAQVAAQHGHPVLLADADPAAIARAREGHAKAMAREVEKGRLTAGAADAVLGRITYIAGVTLADLAPFTSCELVIEAIVERLDAKRALFSTLEQVVQATAVLATNTSSLAVGAIAGACARPERVVGVHFFNPVPVMPLVEIVPALTTSATITPAAFRFSFELGERRPSSRQIHRASSSTGSRARFTANRCASWKKGSPTARRLTGRCAKPASAWARSSSWISSATM